MLLLHMCQTAAAAAAGGHQSGCAVGDQQAAHAPLCKGAAAASVGPAACGHLALAQGEMPLLF
jgi:hypothetical protein